MTAILISSNSSYPFGQMTIQAVSRLFSANAQMQRLQEAIATASLDYTGVAGTEYEASSTGPAITPGGVPQNLFGVLPSDVPGEKGLAYSTAATALLAAWDTFWAAAEVYAIQLDNGGTSM